MWLEGTRQAWGWGPELEECLVRRHEALDGISSTREVEIGAKKFKTILNYTASLTPAWAT